MPPPGKCFGKTGSETEDAYDLLGTAGDWLLAGGRRLYWDQLERRKPRPRETRPGPTALSGRATVADCWPVIPFFGQRATSCSSSINFRQSRGKPLICSPWASPAATFQPPTDVC